MLPLWILFAVVALFLIRKFFKGKQFTENVSAKGKFVLITGANSGCGFQTARELNLRGATVYMLCRNGERAQYAKKELTKLGCDPTRLVIKIIDLADFSSIRKFAKEIEQELPRVDVLINNAGLIPSRKFESTIDGHEVTWQSNYLGHFLLTELMLPLLKKSANGRIVNVSARLHRLADSVKLYVVNDPKKYGFFAAYNRSKLGQIMHARELTRRLRMSDPASTVTINALHPGAAQTNLMKNTILGNAFISKILAVFSWFFCKTDKDLAQTTLFLSLSKSVESVSGKYFRECKEDMPSLLAMNDEACSDLYDESMEAVGMTKLK